MLIVSAVIPAAKVIWLIDFLLAMARRQCVPARLLTSQHVWQEIIPIGSVSIRRRSAGCREPAPPICEKIGGASYSLVSATAIENCGNLEAFEHLIWGEGLSGRQTQGHTIRVDHCRPEHCPGTMVITLEGGTSNRTIRQAIQALCHR